jgi:ATP-dependent DNA helicase RecQ
MPVEQVQQQLLQLQSFGIIEYLPQKDTPQIHYLLNRAPAEYLHINQDKYLERKKQFTERVENMIRYISLTDQCRSTYIANYFGDQAKKDCGWCDNCLAKKRKAISPEDFLQIETQIKQHLATPITTEALISSLKQFSKEKTWAVLDFLLAEQVILVDEQGYIRVHQ